MTLAKVAEAFAEDTHTIMRGRMEGPSARTPPRDGSWSWRGWRVSRRRRW
jgi:hypothetical protein